MTNIEDAFQIINKSVHPLGTIELALEDALGFTLSEEITSQIHMPPFNQSAMDGYAINSSSDALLKERFVLVDEIKAGDNASNIKLAPSKAIRIFTGAMIPEGTTHVAQQEIALVENGTIRIQKELKIGANIRLKGEQIIKGANVCPAGTKLNAAIIGYLATLGIEKVTVFKRPNIGILNTGDELQVPGENLEPGKVYESNGIMLTSLLKEMNLSSKRHRVEDHLTTTKEMIKQLSDENDLLIITGGISVGDYDFVGKALDLLGCKKQFYKVKQKPGKPLYYGILNGTHVFALPGNPAAVITCFHLYVKPAIKLILGYNNDQIRPSLVGKLSDEYTKKGDRPVFLKAKVDTENQVTLLSHQSSAMLNSFVQANCFAFISGEVETIKANDEIVVYPI